MKNSKKDSFKKSILKNYSSSREVFEDGHKYLMGTYTRMPVVFKKAKMQYLWDIEGNKYTDFTAGYGCLNVGHSNPYVVDALKKQISKIIQPSNIFYNETQVILAKLLGEATGFANKVFFANSGAEAIEGALKLARKYSTEKYSFSRYEVVSFNKSFHGRTFGALSATAQDSKQNIFKPLLQGFRYADFNDIDSLNKTITQETCAVLIELIQGEGGINIADMNFIKQMKDVCIKKDILLIFDEIQTGFGRTGKMFAYNHYNVLPDIAVFAKSLGGGMPIGAIAADDNISKVFSPGSHGSTFGGNAASCAAGIAVLNYFKENNLIEHAEEMGKYLFSKLELFKKNKEIKDIRGMGLMAAIEFKKPASAEIIRKGLKSGFVLNKVSDYTVRLLPPLIINKKNINDLIKFFKKAIEEIS